MIILKENFPIFFYFFLFILGASIGSFLNVLIDRLPFEKPINGRSICDHCHRQLAWYDLIPIVSFFLLRGKCRYCGKKISFYYPLVEFITGVSFVFVFLKDGFLKDGPFLERSVLLMILLMMISCLIVIFFSDLKYHLIPDQVQVALFIFGLILLPFHGSFLPLIFVNRVLAALLVAAPIFFIHFFTNGKAMGFGDVKLAFNIGFLLGIKAGFLALYFAFVLGGILGIFLILLKRKKLKSKIAFGPFLVVGLLIMLFFANKVWWAISKMYGL